MRPPYPAHRIFGAAFQQSTAPLGRGPSSRAFRCPECLWEPFFLFGVPLPCWCLLFCFVPFCGGWQFRIDPSGDRTARQWVVSQQGQWPGACPVGTSQGTVCHSGTQCTWGVPSAVLCLLQNSHLSRAEDSGVQLSSGPSFGEQYWASAARPVVPPYQPQCRISVT